MAYSSVPKQSTQATETDTYVPVTQVPVRTWRAGFDKTVAADGVDTDDFTIIGTTGTGIDISQTGGSLVITSGTTARAEVIIRSVDTFRDDFNLRYGVTMSQRIANNNFFVEMVDVIGDGLAYSIGSATAITVTIPSNPFTASNVGQSVYLGAFAGTGTFLSGRYPIASVAGNDVTFTVSAFAAGTGTVSVFGWNYHHVLYNGTTATTAAYDTQRNGWGTGDTTATINTTASGHVGSMGVSNSSSFYIDQLGTSSTTLETTLRASRVRNIPDSDILLRVQVRCANGSTAPATTTTFTLGFIELTNQAAQPVSISRISPQGANNALPVQVLNTATVSGSVTAIVGASSTTAGQTTARIAALSNTAQSVKTSGARLYGYFIQNPDTSAVWVHFYNALIAGVTVGTTIPLWSVWVPASGATDISLTVPISFGTAISTASTTTLTGSTAPATATIAFIGYA